MYIDRLNKLKEKYQRRLGQRESLHQQKDIALDQLNSIKKQREDNDSARIIIHNASSKARELARQTIENLITDALQAVFGDNMECSIEFKEKTSGKPEAELFVISQTADGIVKANPINARGGGVVDIVALAARLAEIELLTNPQLQGTIFLDEPTRNLSSEEYRQSLSTFLAEYSKQFNRQIVIITQHQSTVYASDKAYYIEQQDGVSTIKSL